jgi:large subunit ribosomal protein L15
MKIHTLKSKTQRKRKVQVGRGGTRGKTSGRGTKGQNARAGHKKRPEMRDIIKKIPKQRGRGKNIFQSFQAVNAVVNLSALNEVVKGGESVTPAFLLEHKLIEKVSGRMPKVKILGTGEITQAINISGCKISSSAKEKIEKVGGKVA